jgi:polyphosphate glucokinase
VRIKTPKPATPETVVAALISLSRRLGQFDRVSIGFPGVVRADFVLTAPNLGTKEWHGFKLGAVLAEAIGKPVRMLMMMPASRASGLSPGEASNAF